MHFFLLVTKSNEYNKNLSLDHLKMLYDFSRERIYFINEN